MRPAVDDGSMAIVVNKYIEVYAESGMKIHCRRIYIAREERLLYLWVMDSAQTFVYMAFEYQKAKKTVVVGTN